MAFRYADVVALTVDLPDHGLARSAIGTIVHVFSRPTKAYLVEFADDEGRTTAMLPLLPEQVTAYTGTGSTAHAAE